MNKAQALKLSKVSLFAGVLAAITSLWFTPVTVHQGIDLMNLRFGWPFPFLKQGSVLTPPKEWFPHTFSSPIDPRPNPSSILWPQLLVSVASFAVAFFVLGMIVQMVVKRTASK